MESYAFSLSVTINRNIFCYTDYQLAEALLLVFGFYSKLIIVINTIISYEKYLKLQPKLLLLCVFDTDHWEIITENMRKIQNNLIRSVVTRYILFGRLFKCYNYFQAFRTF